jgi:hypothetical protein
MEYEQNVDQVTCEWTSRPGISKLAVGSLVFATLGPLSAGAMWILSFNDFTNTPNAIMTGVFSCGLTWVLGLLFAIRSLDNITASRGRLLGKEYAVAGAVISGSWLIFILAALFLPALFYVNS